MRRLEVSSKRSFTFLLICIAAYGCGSSKKENIRSPAGSLAFPQGTPVSTKSETGGVVIASVDPNSKSTQIVSASANSRVKNTSIAFPPGSIAVATNITIAEGETLEKSAIISQLGISGVNSVVTASPPVEILPSLPIDLKVPMVISLDVPPNVNLTNLTNSPDALAKLGIVYRVRVQLQM